VSEELKYPRKNMVIENGVIVDAGEYCGPPDELVKARATIARLREALEPFASFAAVIDEAETNWGIAPSPDEKAIHGTLTVGTFRRARTALQETQHE
jgi:hypothetical protein